MAESDLNPLLDQLAEQAEEAACLWLQCARVSKAASIEALASRPPAVARPDVRRGRSLSCDLGDYVRSPRYVVA